jgi:abhydrolase domain-containing protein 6
VIDTPGTPVPKRRRRPWTAAFLFVLLLAGAYVAVGLLRPDWVLQGEFARLRLLAQADTRSVQVGDHRIVYVESGRGPLVVLLHGFTGSKENWLPLMRRLRATHRVVAPDLPGWGESTRLPDADYGPVAQAGRVRAFLRALPAAEGAGSAAQGALPALVVGHSMGGQILGLLAARHPDAVGPIVLMDSAGVPFRANAFGLGVLAGDNPFEATTRAQVHRYLGIVFTDPPFVPWPADEAIARRRQRDAAFEQSVLARIGRGPEALQLAGELGAIRAPVLLLWCRDDRVIDPSAAAVFAGGLRDSRTVLLDGCGHMPMMAKPDAVAAALADFARGKAR